MQCHATGSLSTPYISYADRLINLGKVPGSSDDLHVKATATGITILGKLEADPDNPGKERLVPTGRFKKRYAGSKQYAVDINGRLWYNASELKKVESLKEDKPQKKRTGLPPRPNLSLSIEPQQISDEIAETAKKQPVKKLYTINKKEVRHRLLQYINTQKGKKELYFWTVSFPMGTPDHICFQILNIWLTSLRKYNMLKDYLRVTERQQNGTIHFHIAIPHRMPVQRANAMMRGTLKTFAKRGEIPYGVHSPQISKYNGVDICKNRKTGRVTNFAIKKGARALATYLTKYVTKNDTEFEFLAWHNSRGFSALFTGITFTLQEFKEFGFRHFLNRVRIYRMNFAIFIPWLHGPPPLFSDHLYNLNSYIQTSVNVSDQPTSGKP